MTKEITYIKPPVAPGVVERLVRREIAAMEPYTPIVPFEVLSQRLGLPPEAIVKLDANENPYGPSPRAVEALARYRYFHIYPDPEQHALREALSAYLGMPKTMIMAGAGADELIDLLMRLFIEPGNEVINCPPTFGMYEFDAALQGGQVIMVPRRDDFSVDVDAIEAVIQRSGRSHAGVRPKLLFLASPNNPDGSLLSDEALRRLLRLPIVIVLDEAYAEFAGQSMVRWVRDYPNLIVLRTFSKWAGLAGLRVGYGVFPENIIRHLWKIKQPYNVSVAATVAAIASLEDAEYLRANVAKIVAERERLMQILAGFDFLRPYPSSANFILCRVIGRDAYALKKALEARGVLVRHYRKPGLTDCIRVSVGKPEQTDRLAEALTRVGRGE
jgi:histidinol-phosphate aminotransferase